MPNKQFLEEYPLYKKFKLTSIPTTLDKLDFVKLNMDCQRCESSQTFAMNHTYYQGFKYSNAECDGVVLKLVFLCAHCETFERLFFIKIHDGHLNDDSWYMKVGQYPAWYASAEPNIEKLLGRHSSYYRKALNCESHDYGIGAFGYYRRIVEEVIDELLNQIVNLLSEDELAAYNVALEKTKVTTVTADKIALVKDLLPPILRPNGMNPLGLLHSTLSEGLHAESDEECLELAGTCREVLVFLVSQISATKQATKTFTDSIKKLLDKKNNAKVS